MGGEYNPTNVIKWVGTIWEHIPAIKSVLFHIGQPIVCGITSLDFDHTKQLGSTLGEIAWHKAGIFKARMQLRMLVKICFTTQAGRPAYTIPQEREAMQVIRERSSHTRVQRKLHNCFLDVLVVQVASLNIVPQWHEYPTQLISKEDICYNTYYSISVLLNLQIRFFHQIITCVLLYIQAQIWLEGIKNLMHLLHSSCVAGGSSRKTNGQNFQV